MNAGVLCRGFSAHAWTVVGPIFVLVKEHGARRIVLHCERCDSWGYDTWAKETGARLRARRTQAAVKAAEKKVLAALVKGPLRLGPLEKATKLSKFYVHKATVTLRAAKRIEKVPGGGRMGFQLVGRKNGG
jgi:hypothetical protein